MFPGAGFLYLASPLWFVVTIVLLLLAIVLWWGISAHWAIPFVWLGSVVASALLADAPRLFVASGTTWSWAIDVTYLLTVATVALALVRIERAYRRKLAADGGGRGSLDLTLGGPVQAVLRPAGAQT